jgi:hypothetical protein
MRAPHAPNPKLPYPSCQYFFPPAPPSFPPLSPPLVFVCLFLLECFARRFGWICGGPLFPPLAFLARLPFPPSPSPSSSWSSSSPRRCFFPLVLDSARSRAGVGRSARTPTSRCTEMVLRGRWGIRWTHPCQPLLLSIDPSAKANGVDESLSSSSRPKPKTLPLAAVGHVPSERLLFASAAPVALLLPASPSGWAVECECVTLHCCRE